MEKKSKREVGYSIGHKDSHCGMVSKDDTGYCDNFLPGAPMMNDYKRAGYCKKVLGAINRPYWCRLFEKGT